MGRTCDTGTREFHTGFWWEDLMEIEKLEHLGVDGRIILNCIFKKCYRDYGLDLSGCG
jgi:hypothetical protein